ncbi:MAG: tetratricopeptide repeat protein [Bradyrhizobium sp.]
MNRRQRRASAKPSGIPATTQQPTPAAFFEAGLRLMRAGQSVQAEKCGRQALAIDPGHADSLHLMGLLCLLSKQFDLAVEWFAQAIRIKADTADYFFNLAVALQHQGRIDDAIKSYDRGLTLRGDFAEGWYKLAQLLLQQGRRDEAGLAFDQAIKTNPRYLEAVNASALLYLEAGSYDAAIARFDQSLQIKPGDAGAFHLRGVAHFRLKRFDEAYADIAKALELAPDHPEVTANLGLVLQRLGRDEEALAYSDRALALKPDLAGAFNNRGTSLQGLHRFDEALASFERAIALEADYADAHWNAALLRLLLGDFAKGWAGREWGRKCKAVNFVDRRFAQPLWLGEEPLKHKTILLHSDEGFGDTIQFSRYAPLVAATGARVILEVPDLLHPLLTGLEGVALCLPKGASRLPDFDLHCPLSSLPLALGTRLETIPAAPALPPLPEAVVQAWQARLGSHKKLRVGLVWSGNPAHGNDRNRSMPLRTLSALMDIDASFVSLQKDPRPEDAAVLRTQPEILDPTEHLTDFVQTAALISCLDLVITVDTSVAHLSGALRRPTCILLPFTPDYRWLLGRDDSPWYPTVRLFRQTATRDYANVLERVRDELNRAMPSLTHR